MAAWIPSMALLQGWRGSYSAKTWHIFSMLASTPLATKPNILPRQSKTTHEISEQINLWPQFKRLESVEWLKVDSLLLILPGGILQFRLRCWLLSLNHWTLNIHARDFRLSKWLRPSTNRHSPHLITLEWDSTNIYRPLNNNEWKWIGKLSFTLLQNCNLSTTWQS